MNLYLAQGESKKKRLQRPFKGGKRFCKKYKIRVRAAYTFLYFEKKLPKGSSF
ncbi:hypothetical protein J34TS1_55390 [Paenibacillus azoreducens]|uniref:Uncharacterized protein n=1 Tax=Paenibacillus azoreducens TaxID=116718 RepID=A0A919YHV1_9BACL|nr:hypothetical protein J34TS1_55390 [Paenibacillus azoreducens]